MRQRKTVDVFVLQGNYGYGNGWEDLTAEFTRFHIRQQLKEYQQNEGGNYRIRNKREPRTPELEAQANQAIQEANKEIAERRRNRLANIIAAVPAL